MRQFKPGQLQTGSLYPITASQALTASYLSGSISIDTGSLVTTSSFNAFTSSYYADSSSFQNRVTNLENFSASLDATYATDAELNAATASLSASISNLSSSFKIFSGSYNTGSFTGSFTGSLQGTASYALSSSYSLSSSYALTASYVTPLQQNVIITGSIYIPDNAHSVYFSGSNAASRLTWNDADGTLDLGLKGGNVTLQIGQEQVQRVVNKTGADLLESQYRAVRIRRVDEGGAQGQRLAIVLAQGNTDPNSVDTLGIVTENITNNEEGFITTSGLVRGINTTGALQGETWTDGDVLYLSPFTPGVLTKIKPIAPNHTVVMGYVVYAHANQGKIFVKVDNGYEIDELHNVLINTASLAAGQLLVRSGSNATGVWINSNQLTGSYGLTGSLTATSITASNLYAGATYISGSLIVNGQSTFYGTASFVNVTASNLFISQSFISVNVFEPIERFGGLKVYDSGSGTATASLAWDSLHNHWVYQNVDGATYTGGMLLSGPRNTGSLGDEPNLTKWLVPRSDGGDHLENSQIFTSGSVTQITGSLTVTGGVTASLFGNASTATSASFATSASQAALSNFATSASYAVSASYLDNYIPPFPYTGSASITGSLDVTGSFSVNNGTNVKLDTATSILTDNTNYSSVDWQNRSLNDEFSIQSINWRTRDAYDSVQSSSINWNLRTLKDSGNPGASGIPVNSIDWESRQAYDAAGILSIDWSTGDLIDSSGNQSIQWVDRTQYDVNGNAIIDYSGDSGYNIVNYRPTVENLTPGIQDEFTQTSIYGLSTNAAGNVISVGSNIDLSVTASNPVFLDIDGIWKRTDQTTDSTTKLQGICVSAYNKGAILTEGIITVTTSSGYTETTPFVSGSSFHGMPVYLTGSMAVFTTDTPTSGYVKIVGHMYYNSPTNPDYWIMKFNPSNDWYEI